MEQAVKDYKIGGGFAFMNAPFASHPNDERRAKETLDMMLGDNLTLNQIRSLFQAYIDKAGGSLKFRERQMARVSERLAAWIR